VVVKDAIKEILKKEINYHEKNIAESKHFGIN
jgi:hypothetical protein